LAQPESFTLPADRRKSRFPAHYLETLPCGCPVAGGPLASQSRTQRRSSLPLGRRGSSPVKTISRGQRDLSAARAAPTAAGVRFTQWGRHSLPLRVESDQSTAGRIELTDED
jgi:hypothetical protein